MFDLHVRWMDCGLDASIVLSRYAELNIGFKWNCNQQINSLHISKQNFKVVHVGLRSDL